MADEITVREVPFASPAVTAILERMDAEMGALYDGVDADLSPELIERVNVALAVDASSILVSVGAFDGGTLVGHAALRPFEDSLEVKRVFVDESVRGRGVSRLLMNALEQIARKRGARSLVLQTGDRQAAAIALYLSLGYVLTESFGRYAGVPFFLCYEKTL
ncbi:MAG: family N-acetyltransferase [Glaciihabitans sp.]|nr:family N-acetyltransferase [Glaciihabitans sp.]